MSDEKIYIKDGNRVYEVRGDRVSGYYDATGAPINGDPLKISGDSVSGFHDATGKYIRLRRVRERER